ncbi:MAG: T9SS type A sorting domain-containing protein, partial [Saprospiraceae bacterium]
SDDADNTICAGDAVTFTGSGATSYSFDVNGGTPVAGAGANSDEFSSATLANGDVVTVTGTNANGCINTASITMTVNPLPTAGLTSDKAGNAVCIGETITFTGTGGATYEFLVDAGSGYTTAQAASADASYDVNTLVNGDKVKVTVTNANGCVATSSEITVTVNPLPTTTLASDDADSRVCQGQVVTFTATSASADEFIFYVNAVEVQAQSADATYEYTTGTDGDVITVVGVNTTSGCSQIAAETFTMDVDGCHSLSGNLLYKNSAETPMGNVVITITGPGLAPNTTITTDNTGSFAIDNLFDTETYNFAYATTKSHSGTNSTDALKALAEATNQTTLTGLYLAAADVSQSSGVTSADALEIQRRFVFVTSTAFTGGLDWVFEAGSFTPNGGDITGQKLYALAMGDINGSYTPNIMENGTPTVSMINDGQMVVNNGDRVQIPVRIKNGENVGAMSLSMYFPSNAMTVHDITSDNGTSLLNNVNGDEIRMAWADINAKLFADDDVVYYIDATINDVALYNAAPLGINLVSELANAIGTVLEDVTLGIPTINATITNTNSIEAAAASVRSFPNPFSNQMTIEYDLPSTSQVAIQMYNSLGQEIATLVNESQQEGTHRAIWNADNKAAGVYFYTITVTEGTNSYKKTKQVILVK